MAATCKEVVPFCVFYLTTFLVKDVTLTDKGRRTFQGEEPPKYYFLHHKSHMDCPGIEYGHRGEKPTTNLSESWHGLFEVKFIVP